MTNNAINNGFELVSGDFWIKKINSTNFEVVQVNRTSENNAFGWVDFYQIDINDYSYSFLKDVLESENIEYNGNLFTREQILSESLVKGHFVDPYQKFSFTDDFSLTKVLEHLGITEQ